MVSLVSNQTRPALLSSSICFLIPTITFSLEAFLVKLLMTINKDAFLNWVSTSFQQFHKIDLIWPRLSIESLARGTKHRRVQRFLAEAVADPPWSFRLIHRCRKMPATPIKQSMNIYQHVWLCTFLSLDHTQSSIVAFSTLTHTMLWTSPKWKRQRREARWESPHWKYL